MSGRLPPGSSSSNSNQNSGQPTYSSSTGTPQHQSTGVRASFTVVAPQGAIPHSHILPPPTVGRIGPQGMVSNAPPQLQPMSPRQQQVENLLHVLSEGAVGRVNVKLQHLKVKISS